MRFKQVVGNKKIKNQLISSVENNRIAHAHLFSGESGGSKLIIAIAFAQYINCKNKLNEDSCGDCPSCKKYENLTHPDLHLIFPVLTNSKIKKPTSDNYITEFREEVLKNPYLTLNNWFDIFSKDNKTGKQGHIYIQEIESLHNKMLLKTYESEYRIVILWMPEYMQLSTSNKILKILEDPPEKTIFILVSEKPQNLLSTIISRLQITNVTNNTQNEKEEIVRNQNIIDEDEIKNMLNIKNGNLGDTIFLLNNDIKEENYLEEFKTWMRLCYAMRFQELIQWTNDRSQKGRMDQSRFLEFSLKIIRMCLIYNYANTNIINPTEKETVFLSKFHTFINKNNITEITKRIESSIRNIERNANPKITIFELSLQLIKLLKVNRKLAV